MADKDNVLKVTKDYYDSEDADNFYYTVWGGEDLHLGIYNSPEDSIYEASRRTIDQMADTSKTIGPGKRVLDIGAGFGGTARHLVKTYGCHVTCLNLSTVENERNVKMNKEQGIDDMIDVVDGYFEDLPFDDAQFDIVWSQDAILHSYDRKKVVEEVARVLRPGGEFIFTDPMRADNCPDGVLGPILERIHLNTLGSPGFYKACADDLGFEVIAVKDQTPNLTRHYSRVLQETERMQPQLKGKVSDEYIERMKMGLQHWISGGEKGHLAWCIFNFRKPE